MTTQPQGHKAKRPKAIRPPYAINLQLVNIILTMTTEAAPYLPFRMQCKLWCASECQIKGGEVDSNYQFQDKITQTKTKLVAFSGEGHKLGR